MKRLPVKSVLLILSIMALLFTANIVIASEWDASDIPPRIENILFSKEAVGFVTTVKNKRHKEYYIYDRKSWLLRPVKKEWFLKKFDVRHTPEPSVEKGSVTILRASNGLEFRTEGGYCFENEKKQPHKLWLAGKLIKDHADPCRKISAVEVVDDQLWLGSVFEGFTGNSGRALVIQSLKDDLLIKKIMPKDGLLYNDVRIIRHDPYTGKFLAASYLGLNLIHKNGKVEKAGFFYEDFDPETGEPVFFINKSFKKSNLLAGIGRVLGVEDTMAYYKAVQKIPEEVLSKVSPYSYYMGMWSTSRGFLPQEMNVLVPFFLEAVKSGENEYKGSAEVQICAFNDERVISHIQTLALTERTSIWTDRCIDKYAKLGLLDEGYKSKRSAMLLEKVKKALGHIRAGYPSPSIRSLPGGYSFVDYADTVISSTKSLKKMGDLRGFELIKKYFEAFDLKTAENNRKYLTESFNLHSAILRELYSHKEIKPIVLVGIKKGLSRGCSYFNTKHAASYGKQFGAKYADIMLVSMDKFHNLPTKPISLPPGLRLSEEEMAKINFNDPCIDAFDSQMENENVKKDFLKNYYPKLTKRQKETADSLLAGTYKGPDAEEIKKQLREQVRKQHVGSGIGIGVFRQPGH